MEWNGGFFFMLWSFELWLFISNGSASFIGPKSSFKFVNSFLGFIFGLANMAYLCWRKILFHIRSLFTSWAFAANIKLYSLVYLVTHLRICGVDVCFFSLLFPLLQNGTKDSISKLVSELNAATLETDVGKPICFILTYPSLPLSRIFPFGACIWLVFLCFPVPHRFP